MENSNVPLNHSTVREETEGTTYEAIHPERNHITHDNGSARTSSIDNATARNSQQINDTGFSNVTGGVDIRRAESDFAELSKELSRTSNISRRLSRVQSRQSRKDQGVTDIEKADIAASDVSSDEAFDLEKTLRGSRDEEEAAGIKSKRIGVVWEGLTVSGVGGVKNYVKVSRLDHSSTTA
jgi:ATP-binding cassette subfamily G (WHITE) protein 2 (SNQ2)